MLLSLGYIIILTNNISLMKNLTVVKSNKVIEAGYRLSLNEQRLVLACIAQIKKGQSLGVEDKFTISASEFADMFDIPLDGSYTELQRVSERLYERSVTIDSPDPDNPKITFTRTRWITSISYIPRDGHLVLQFAPQMIPYISLLEAEFTRYSLASVAEMNSIYGIRFYELMMQWGSFGERSLEIDELKTMLGLEGRYKAIKDFKLRVIDPALKDINQYSDLTASYDQRKCGRRVSHIIFRFHPKGYDKKVPAKITKKFIEQHARPGESYKQVELRLKAAN